MSEQKTETLTLKTYRTATSEEVESLIFGTGALTWDWWHFADKKTKDDVAGYEFTHDNKDDERTKTWVSEQQILDAAGRFIAEGRLQYDVVDVMTDSIGYLDAADADVVLQYAVLGEIVFG